MVHQVLSYGEVTKRYEKNMLHQASTARGQGQHQVLTFGFSSAWNDHAKLLLSAPHNAVDRVFIVDTRDFGSSSNPSSNSRLLGAAALQPLAKADLQHMPPPEHELHRLAEVCRLSDMSVRLTSEQKYAVLGSIKRLLQVAGQRRRRNIPKYLVQRIFDYACHVVEDLNGDGRVSSGVDLGSLGFPFYGRKMMLVSSRFFFFFILFF